MIWKKNDGLDTFHTGRGNPASKLAKSGLESGGAAVGGMEAVPGDAGAKAVYATGERPFHEGRGLGRGHGPETK